MKNVKLMWNDWFIDIGSGIHTDKKEAQAFVKASQSSTPPTWRRKIVNCTIFSITSFHLALIVLVIAGAFQMEFLASDEVE